MICVAGAETEAHWVARAQGAPVDWEGHLKVGAQHDRRAAVELASYACGSAEETSAYIEWLRQRVLNKVGRCNAEGEGNARFWTLVGALADAVVTAGTLQWRQARNVLQDADRKRLVDGRKSSPRALRRNLRTFEVAIIPRWPLPVRMNLPLSCNFYRLVTNKLKDLLPRDNPIEREMTVLRRPSRVP
ncbi:MAG: hypothetical protein ACRDRY_10320 [Pseudonocardiaceae bacterium]